MTGMVENGAKRRWNGYVWEKSHILKVKKPEKTLFQIGIGPRKKIRLRRSTQKNEICRSAETDLLKSWLNDRHQFGHIFYKITIFEEFSGWLRYKIDTLMMFPKFCPKRKLWESSLRPRCENAQRAISRPCIVFKVWINGLPTYKVLCLFSFLVFMKIEKYNWKYGVIFPEIWEKSMWNPCFGFRYQSRST